MNSTPAKLILIGGGLLLAFGLYNLFNHKSRPIRENKIQISNPLKNPTGETLNDQAIPPNHDLMIQAQDLKEKLKQSPDNLMDNIQLGNILFDLGRYEEAIPYYETALAQQPQNDDVRVDKAICDFNLGLNQKAIEELNTVIKQNPDHLMALFNLGVIHSQSGNKSSAQNYWQSVLNKGGNSEIARKAKLALEHLE